MFYSINQDWIYRIENHGGLFYNREHDSTIIVNEYGNEVSKLLLTNDGLNLTQIGTNIEFATDEESIKSFLEELTNIGIVIRKDTGSERVIMPSTISQQEYTNYFSSPLFIEIYPTFRCNLRCKFCFLDKPTEDMNYEMNYEDFINIINQSLHNDVFYISLLGGEPFLLPWITDAIQYCEKNKMRLEIVSNGTLITDEDIQVLKNTKYVSISLSLHGKKTTHNYLSSSSEVYQKIIKTMENLYENNINFGIGCTISKINCKVSELNHILDISQKFDVENVSYRSYQNFGYGKKSEDELLISNSEVLNEYKKIERRENLNTYLLGSFAFLDFDEKVPENRLNLLRYSFCSAAVRKLDVLPDSKVTPCIQLWQLDKRNYIIGDLKKEEILEVWKNAEMLNELRILEPPEYCKSCKYVDICRGGCLAMSLQECNTFERPDPTCPKVRSGYL